MRKRSMLLLLVTAVLASQGMSVRAQGTAGSQNAQGANVVGASGEKYAWRLDSVVYNHLSGEEELHPLEYNRVYYTYDADGFSEINAPIEFVPKGMYGNYYQPEDLYYRINPSCAKYEYRDFGEEGKHTMYLYVYGTIHGSLKPTMDSASSLPELLQLEPDSFTLSRRYDYAYDTYRNIFDEDGHLIRQIRNYDYSIYRLDSSGNWIPNSRTERRETDSTLFSKAYYFNTNEQQWKNTWRTYGQSYYRNHRLWKQEKMWEYDGSLESGTEYNENGGVVRTYEGSSTYGNETYYRSERIIGRSSWAHPTDSYGRIDTSELVTTTEMYPDDVFTRKTMTSKKRDEEYLVEKTPGGNKEYPQHVRSWRYNADSVLTAYSNSVYSYDAENRCTLRVDTALSDGVWTNNRTEYGSKGEVVYSKTQEKRAAIDEWITTSETTPEYTLSTLVNRDATPIQRQLTKTYRYGFGNRYSRTDVYNSASHQWECLSGTDTRLSLGEDGEPLSAIEYNWREYRWEPEYVYAFTYDTAYNGYTRHTVGYMTIGADGNVYSHNYNNGDETYYDAEGNEIGWYNSGQKQGGRIINQYDEYHRLVAKITYRLNEEKTLSDTIQYERYTYFPNDTTTDIARRMMWFNKNTTTQTWQISDLKYTKTYSIYSKEGILLHVDTYGWEGDEIVLTQTMRHNDLVYDNQGRIKERITYRTANIGYNVPNMRYVYYYREDTDPQWYAVIQWGSYNFFNDSTWASQHVPEYQDYTVQDKQGRVIERIGYKMNSDNTAILPSTRSVYYYADDAEDWTTADNYTMNNNGEWYCNGVSIHGYTQQAELDGAGNVLSLATLGGTCEQGIGETKKWSYSYGAELSEEPVLSPAAYNMTEEIVNSTRPDFSPVASRRLKHLTHTDLTNYYKNYTADYYYTALQEGVVADRMPVSIETEETSAVFTWGAVEGAETYVLHVYRDEAQAEEICYVVFDKYGRVISINFVRRTPAYRSEAEQLSYTLDGLRAGTAYRYSVEGVAADGKAVESTHGTFRTKGEGQGTEGIETVQKDDVPCTKVLIDGQLYILREGKRYDVMGR